MYEHLHDIAARVEHQQHLHDLTLVQVPVRHSRITLLCMRTAEALRLRRQESRRKVALGNVRVRTPRTARPQGATSRLVVDVAGRAHQGVFASGAGDPMVYDSLSASVASRVGTTRERVEAVNEQR